MPWAASLPRTSAREGDDIELLEVEARQMRPKWRRRWLASRSAEKSAFGTRTPEVVPFQVKTTSRLKSIWKGRQLAVVGFELVDVLQLQLLDDVGDPAGAEGFQAIMSTPRWLSSDHSAISTAPVSDAGTMPMRQSANRRISRVTSIAYCSFVLLIFARCERPSGHQRESSDHPGRLARTRSSWDWPTKVRLRATVMWFYQIARLLGRGGSRRALRLSALDRKRKSEETLNNFEKRRAEPAVPNHYVLVAYHRS